MYEKEQKRLANQSFTTKKSKQLVESSKYKRLKELFNYFDTDNDGYIDVKQVELHSLDPALARELVCVFRRFEDEVINFDEFYKAMLERMVYE